MPLTIHEKGLTIPKPYQSIAKSEKYETFFFVFKLLIWRQKCMAVVPDSNSFVVTVVKCREVGK